MRAQALFGGLVIIAAVAVWHGWSPTSDVDRQSACERMGVGYVCKAVASLSKGLRGPLLRVAPDILPPPTVPGATDAAISQANIEDTICRPGYARLARPAYAITGPLKRRMMTAQHFGERMADYELDHLIPISIGGAPLDIRDLWLQPRRGQANAGDKNVLAYVLWRLVCTHQMPLATAQREISHDWTRAYQRYATPENIAKYHFRHAEENQD